MKQKRSRREFVRTAALAVAGTALVDTAAQAQEEVQDPLADVAQRLTEIVRARHGKHVTEAQLKNIQQAIRRSLANAALLKRTPLQNGDEPAFIFAAEVGM
jgi:hypothetical protein